jgi:hypothetical protein
MYGPAHVQRLATQAREFAPGEPFACLSDVMVRDVEVVALTQRRPGWWAKMELFRPRAFACGTRVLYVDLDTTLVGPLAGLLARPESFLAIADFYRRPPAAPARGIGSGLMMWTAGEQDDLFTLFEADPDSIMRRYQSGGDQRFIEAMRTDAVTFWQDVVPGQVVSYKVHCRPRVPDEARVVCFHGHPKPWDVPPLTREALACQ